MTTFRPFSNFLLIEPVEIPDTTPSGLYLTEAAKEKPNQGIVIAIGDGQLSDRLEHIPLSAKVGDRVLFPKYSGTELKLNGKKYLLMRDTDLYGAVDSE